MKKLTDHECKSAGLMHIDLQGILDDQCFGDMEQEPIYKKGILINRLWHCSSCGETYTENEIMKIKKEAEYEHACQVNGL